MRYLVYHCRCHAGCSDESVNELKIFLQEKAAKDHQVIKRIRQEKTEVRQLVLYDSVLIHE
jgi:hypothetical protein